MNRLFSAKPLLAAALAIGALGAASAAHARSDVQFSIGIGAPIGYVQPAPVYVQPQPVYVQPQPVYVYPYARPHRHHHRHDEWRYHDRRGGAWDADRDGVPNRYDRAPRNPYRY